MPAKGLGDERLNRLWELAQPLLRRGRALRHTVMALSVAKRLVARANGDPLIVLAAVMLHDVGYAETRLKWTEVPSGRLLSEHMEVGAKLAESLLSEVGFDGYVKEKVVYIVRNHDLLYGEALRGVCLNVKLAVEADRLASRTSLYGVKLISKLEGRPAVEVVEDFERRIDEYLATEVSKELARRRLERLRLIVAGK